MNNDLFDFHSHFISSSDIRKLMCTKCKYELTWRHRDPMKILIHLSKRNFITYGKIILSTPRSKRTQWAAVITISGSQLKRSAPHPAQTPLPCRIATCHGSSFSRTASPPTTLSAFFFNIPPNLPQFVAFFSFCKTASSFSEEGPTLEEVLGGTYLKDGGQSG